MTAKLRKGGGLTAYRAQSTVDPFAAEFVDALAAHRFRTIENAASEETSTGWITPEDPTGDTFAIADMDAGNAIWLRVRQDSKRLPAIMLDQHVALRERALGRPLRKKEMRELRGELVSQLLPRILPSSTNVDALFWPDQRLVLLLSTSKTVRDAFGSLWAATFGAAVDRLDAPALAIEILPPERNQALRDLQPTRWRNVVSTTTVTVRTGDGREASAPIEDLTAMAQGGFEFDSTFGFLGEEFLLWLWWHVERGGGSFDVGPDASVDVSITDLLTFAPKHQDDTEQTLRRGMPTRTPEARAALRSGHRLARARMLIAEGEHTWELTLHGDGLACASVKLPADQEDAETQADRNADRAANWLRIAQIKRELFSWFVAVRFDANRWPEIAAQISTWMAE